MAKNDRYKDQIVLSGFAGLRAAMDEAGFELKPSETEQSTATSAATQSSRPSFEEARAARLAEEAAVEDQCRQNSARAEAYAAAAFSGQGTNSIWHRAEVEGWKPVNGQAARDVGLGRNGGKRRKGQTWHP